MHAVFLRCSQLPGTAALPWPGRDRLPLYLAPVAAGFPSPDEDYPDRKLDLHEYLARNEAACFFLRAHADSLLGAGIHDRDLLIADRSLEAGHNRGVIAALGGELAVKRLLCRKGRVLLTPIPTTRKSTSPSASTFTSGAW